MWHINHPPILFTLFSCRQSLSTTSLKPSNINKDKDFQKNVTAELNAVLLDTFNDCFIMIFITFNPLHAKLNLICHLLTLLGAHLIFHVSRIRVKKCVAVKGKYLKEK
jgi:hypothetical protein